VTSQSERRPALFCSVLCCAVLLQGPESRFSHAPAKIPMGKAGLTPHMCVGKARQAPRMVTRELSQTVRAAATHDALPARTEWTEWDTSQFAGGQQHTRHLSSKPPTVFPFPIATSCLLTNTSIPPSILCSSSHSQTSPPSKPYASPDRPSHTTLHSLVTDPIGGSTPT
jgi:hypothetical protein